MYNRIGLLIILICTLLSVQTFAVEMWAFYSLFPADTTAATGWPLSAGTHGIAVDPDGKVWLQNYYAFTRDSVLVPVSTRDNKYEYVRCIYVYNRDGSPASFSPIKFITVDGVVDTVGGFTDTSVSPAIWRAQQGTGLRTDQNGNIIVTQRSFVYRINYKTGEGMNKIRNDLANNSGTAAGVATAADGRWFIGTVLPGNPVKEYDKDFNYLGNVTAASLGYSRTMEVAHDGNTAYWAPYNNSAIYKYQRPDELTAFSGPDTVLKGFACESITWHPDNGLLYFSSGSYLTPANQFPGVTTSYSTSTWYGVDVNDWSIRDSLKWTFTPKAITLADSANERPRGLAFSVTGDTAYTACFPYGGVQMLVRQEYADVNVTFRINMSVWKQYGYFNPATDKVVIRGSFNAWVGDADECTPTGEPDIYSLTKTFPATQIGAHFGFKYVLMAGDRWESINNRILTIPPASTVLDLVYFNNQDQYVEPKVATVTFQADMTDLLGQGFTPGTDELLVLGVFNGWSYNDEWITQPDAVVPTLYALTHSISDLPGTTMGWKFRGRPEGRFVDGGWEGGDNHNFIFTGENIILGAFKPNIQLVQPSIILLSPNGGERWRTNSVKEISWSTDLDGNVRLEYQTISTGGWNEITGSTPAGDGRFTWTVPAVESDSCKVRITSLANGGYSDQSDTYFTITQIIPTAESEPNNTADMANWLEYGDSLDAAITPAGDVDYYRFSGAAGDTVEIWGHHRNDSQLGGRIILFRSNGSGISENSGYLNWPLDQRIVCILPASDTYYVRYSFVNNWGSYPNSEQLERLEKEELTEQGKDPAQIQYVESGDYRIGLRHFTASAPSLSYAYVRNVFWNSVQFAVEIDPNFLATEVRFEYGLTSSYGLSVAAEGNPYNYANFNAAYSSVVNGLGSNTIYHFRVVATNERGASTSPDYTFTTPRAPEGWERQTAGVTDYFWDLFFVSSDTGTIISHDYSSYYALRTVDGGQDWTQQGANSDFYKYGVHFISSDTGIVVGSWGTIVKTTDGGLSWSARNSNTGNWLFSVFFIDKWTGWAAGDGGTILKTTDGGESWVAQNSGTTNTLWGVCFTDENTGVAVGSPSTILRTTDGGSTWAPVAAGWSADYRAIDFNDAGVGIIGCSWGNFILRSSDGGVTWAQVIIPSGNGVEDVRFIDTNRTVGVGYNGTILMSSDAGLTWSIQQSGTYNALRAVHSAGGYITVVGEYGTILRSVHYLTLTMPNGGERWRANTVKEISWSTDLSDDVQLDYCTSSTSGWLPVVASTPAAARKYDWSVPEIESESCKVRITSLVDGAFSDESDQVFSITQTQNVEESEPNNSADLANWIDYGDSLDARIDPQGDVDYYKFNGAAGDTAEIWGHHRNDSQLGGLIMLFRSSGEYLENNSGYINAPLDQRIVFTLPATETYYIRYASVDNWGSYPNSEQVSQPEGKEPNNSGEQPAEIQWVYTGDYRIGLRKFEPSAPILRTASVPNRWWNSVQFYAEFNPNGLNTTVRFDYGPTASYSNNAYPLGNPFSGYNFYGRYTDDVTGLSAGTEYHYRGTAGNSAGSVETPDYSFITPAAPDGWERRWFENNSGYWRSICWLSASKAIVLGDNGVLIRTSDGGATWSSQPLDFWNSFAVCFADENRGWIVGYGDIFYSEDAGLTWNAQSNPAANGLRSVHFVTPDSGVAVGYYGTIVRTIDGGANWTLQTSGVTNSLYGVYMVDSRNVIAVGSGGLILRSTDGGVGWSIINSGISTSLYSVSFSDALHGAAAGTSGVILRTVDGGQIWTPQNSGTSNRLYGVSLVDANTGVAVGISGTIVTTTDGGTTWALQNSGTANLLWAVSGRAGGTWGAVGENNAVLCKKVTVAQQHIALHSGWNLISSYMIPPAPAMPALMADIVSRGHLTIAKNNVGQVYWPALGINLIGSWNPLQGYRVYVTVAESLLVGGLQQQPELTSIPLPSGWSMIAYLRENPMVVSSALGSINSSLLIAKNSSGQVYWPALNINNIGSMQSGQGYQVFMSSAAVLTYPANSSSLAKELASAPQPVRIPHHFQLARQLTGNSAILLVRGSTIQDDDEVAVRNISGRIVGAGVVQRGRALITIWGDDSQTSQIDGAREGETLELSLWSHTGKTEIPVQVVGLQDGLGGTALSTAMRFATDAVLIADLAATAALPTDYALQQNYPNPFNPQTTIRFELPKESKMRLIVYNLRGQAIRTLVDEERVAGYYDVIWDGRDQAGEMVSSGLYLLRMEAGSFVRMIKMSLIK